MMKVILRLLIFFYLIMYVAEAHAQTGQNNAVVQILDSYALENPRLDQKVDITFTGDIHDFILAFCKETKVNVSLSSAITQTLTVNFSNVSPRDILLYLVTSYQYDLNVIGDIISITPLEKKEIPVQPKSYLLTYNAYNDQLTYSLKNDTLGLVLEHLSRISGKNIIAKPEVANSIIRAHAVQASFESGLDILAIQNNLTYEKDTRGFFVFALASDSILKEENTEINAKSNVYNPVGTDLKLIASEGTVGLEADSVNGGNYIVINARDANLGDLIRSVMRVTGNQCNILKEPSQKVTYTAKGKDMDALLNSILIGSGLTFTKVGDVVIFDDENSSIMASTKSFQFRHRSVIGMVGMLPKDLVKEVQVQELADLNSILVTGNESDIARAFDFFDKIDKSVPVINIELLIVDVKKSYIVNTGLELGLGSKPVSAEGQLYPAIDFTFSNAGINNLLNLLAGNGIINLGQVKPGFYASLQAVETNGGAKVHSKPLLSTLNGKEAVFSLGEKRYFQIQRTTLQGNQSPISLQDRTYESVNADFSIKILPIVSGDENVTLSIQVDQSDFIGPIQSDAPPPQISRIFNSNIRVKNGEMIVLGGLERKGRENSGTGLPLLSRIPILKWFFSKRSAKKDSSKLLLFVKPTVYY